MRELHWHATAAEWAFVIEGRVRTTVIDPQGHCRDQRLRAGRRLVLPARPRPHARMPRRQAVPLHPDLRQRLLLRVRHVQHHRLDRPHARRRCWRRTSACPSRPSTASRRRRSTSPAGQCRPRSRPMPLQGWKLPPLTHKYRLLAQPPHATYQGRPRVAGRFHAVSRSRRRSPACPRPRPGALRELHWHPNADEWQYVIEGNVSVTMFGSHGRYRTETLAEGRRRLHPAGLRPLDRERRRRSRAAS